LQGLFENEEGTANGLFALIADPSNPASYRVLTTADKGATSILESGVRFALAPPVLAHLDEAGK